MRPKIHILFLLMTYFNYLEFVFRKSWVNISGCIFFCFNLDFSSLFFDWLHRNKANTVSLFKSVFKWLQSRTIYSRCTRFTNKYIAHHICDICFIIQRHKHVFRLLIQNQFSIIIILNPIFYYWDLNKNIYLVWVFFASVCCITFKGKQP